MAFHCRSTGRGILGLLTLMMLVGCNGASDTRASAPAASSSPARHPVVTPTPPPPDTSPPPTSSDNTAPQISGKPAYKAVVGRPFSFQPTATDSDGDALSFSIKGKPSWASFDNSTGHLWGTPSPTDAGTRQKIRISVSDGEHTDALPQFVLPVASTSTLKSNYGHYFATHYSDTPADAATLCEKPGVSGIVWRQTWSQVETAPGNYNFSSFDKVLAAMAASSNPKCQLWLLVEWKSFVNSPVKNPCPAYLQAQHAAANVLGNGAVTCFMWEPTVVRAYVAMMQAAAARFDSNPRVEGLVFQESSLSLNNGATQDVADGGTYTPEAWRDALITIIDQCAAAFATSRCMAFLNFLRGGQSYLHDVSAAISSIPDNQACFSGPDLLPNSPSLYDGSNSAYQVLARHPGCRANSAQNDSYEVPGCALECIFRFAVSGTFGDFPQHAPLSGGVCVNSYLFWNDRSTRSQTGLTWKDALPVIAAHPYGPDWYEHCAGNDGEP
jgi:hypothetical protein